MACPYFCPTEPLQKGNCPGALRPPLGELYAGSCECGDGGPPTPAGSVLKEGCNFGYARDVCERFPGGDGPDAVRFSLAEDDGHGIRILYAIERDHLPYRHGSAVYDLGRRQWKGLEGDTVLRKQAEAYLKSYLRWKEIQPQTSGG